MNRRNFLRTGALSAASVSVLPNMFNIEKKQHGHIGVQLWSVRDDIKKDAKGALAQLASFGYKNVESGNYADGKFYGFTPKEFKAMLDEAGLKMPSGHAATMSKYYDAATGISDGWKTAVESALTVGQKYIINPYMQEPDRKTEDQLKHMIETYNKAAEYAHTQGLKFGYHNHDFEFQKVGDKQIYTQLLEGCDKSLVDFEMDLYWVAKAGENPIEWIDKYPGRFKLFHMKDMAKTATKETIEVGNGSMNFNDILKHRKTAGAEYYIVELENYLTTPLQGVHESLTNLRKLDNYPF